MANWLPSRTPGGLLAWLFQVLISGGLNGAGLGLDFLIYLITYFGSSFQPSLRALNVARRAQLSNNQIINPALSCAPGLGRYHQGVTGCIRSAPLVALWFPWCLLFLWLVFAGAAPAGCPPRHCHEEHHHHRRPHTQTHAIKIMPHSGPSPTLICCKASQLVMPNPPLDTVAVAGGTANTAALNAPRLWNRRRTTSFMTDPTCKFFQRVAAGLRQHCPAAYPVVIRTVWLPGNVEGTCSRRRSRFSIRVADRLDEKSAVEVLLHEWAHARSWNHRLDACPPVFPTGRDPDLEFDELAHGPEWGIAYSLVWRTFTGPILQGEE